MKITAIPPLGWEACTYILSDKSNAVLIDAGANADTVIDLLDKEGLTLKHIVLTHAHFDHTISAEKICKKTGASLLIHPCDTEMFGDPDKNGLAALMGAHTATDRTELDIRPLEGSFSVSDELSVSVIHTPGHSKGSVCLLANDALFTGDTIFNGGFGRYDLYGGNFDDLKSSLKSLGSLEQSLTIYPGHGSSTKLSRALDLLYFI